MALSLPWITGACMLLTLLPLPHGYLLHLFWPTRNFDLLHPPLNCVCVGFFGAWLLSFSHLFLCQNSHKLASQYAPGKSQSHTLWSAYLHTQAFLTVSDCGVFYTVWKTNSSSVESFLLGFSVFWDPFPYLPHSSILADSCTESIFHFRTKSDIILFSSHFNPIATPTVPLVPSGATLFWLNT